MVKIVEAEAGVKVAGVVTVEEVVVVAARAKTKVKAGEARTKRVRCTPDTRRPGMLTNPLSSPVDAIGDSESLLIFVKSQELAHGKMCGFPSQINEIQASPVK